MVMLCIAYGTKIIFFIAGLPPNVLSIRKYLFLLQHILNRALVLLDVIAMRRSADLLLAITSNRNQLCTLHDAFNWPRIMFVLVPFWLFHPPRIISLSFSSSSQHSQNHIWCCFSSNLCSTESGWYYVMLTFFKIFHPPGITSLFYMVIEISSIQQAASFTLTIFYQWFVIWRLIYIGTWKGSLNSVKLTLPFPAKSRNQVLSSLLAVISGSFS